MIFSGAPSSLNSDRSSDSRGGRGNRRLWDAGSQLLCLLSALTLKKDDMNDLDCDMAFMFSMHNSTTHALFVEVSSSKHLPNLTYILVECVLCNYL